MKLNQKIAILGASRGLGEHLAKVITLDNQFEQLFLCSRNMSNLAEGRIIKKSCDFTKPQQQSELLEALTLAGVQKVFYVAGGGPYGNFHLKDHKDHQWAYELNFLFPSRILHWALKQKLHQLIFIGSSICESAPDPKAASYAASKHALKGLISSVQKEDHGVDLRLFSPGYMNTDMLPANAWPRTSGAQIDEPNSVARRLWDWSLTPV